ncbi:serine aminopeptidase domain-containing protein [Neptunicella sp. SCSIO 80796]|uniref:serine aminopeptidase domain-containing protein n=1 Tax=Neptunicella plasticusilytica TaxID=3117012 RepID=UPI003A4D9B96
MNKIILGTSPAIVAHLFQPHNEIKGAVVIAPAMGVAQSFYRSLAEWLNQQGYACITFDYQGMGLSRQGHLKHCRADLLDWATTRRLQRSGLHDQSVPQSTSLLDWP